MRTRGMRRVTARYTWDRLRVSFWFAPAVMAGGAVLLAWLMYYLDMRVSNDLLANSRFVLAGSSSDLRMALLSMATSVLTTAGVVFTLLTLPLSTVVAQYGSRLLRVFLGERTTQLVLAMFVGTFVYCIAAALSILPEEVQPEAPQLTATVGLFLMLATFGSLIVLVQHISTMLQAPNLAAAAGAELLDLVTAETPGEIRSGDSTQLPSQVATSIGSESKGYLVRARGAGYIQAIDPELMLTLAQEKDLTIRLIRRPGHFVVSGTEIAEVWPSKQVDSWVERQLQRAIRIGNQRTPTQDVECAVSQLVEMAVRAMSPAINDPLTAITCLDHLGNGLARFAQQGGEYLNTYDLSGKLRIVFEPVTIVELLDAAFDVLRHASCDNASVLLHMLETIRTVGKATVAPEARQELSRHVGLIRAESHAGALIEQDRQFVGLRSDALQTELAAAVA